MEKETTEENKWHSSSNRGGGENLTDGERSGCLDVWTSECWGSTRAFHPFLSSLSPLLEWPTPNVVPRYITGVHSYLTLIKQSEYVEYCNVWTDTYVGWGERFLLKYWKIFIDYYLLLFFFFFIPISKRIRSTWISVWNEFETISLKKDYFCEKVSYRIDNFLVQSRSIIIVISA